MCGDGAVESVAGELLRSGKWLMCRAWRVWT